MKIRASHSMLLGRLDVPKSNKSDLIRKQRLTARSPLSPRFDGEQSKISACTSSDHSLLGESVQFLGGSGTAYERTSRQNKEGSIRNIIRERHCKTLYDLSGNGSILSRTDPKCKIVHETDTTTFASKLESSPFATNVQNSCYTTASASFELVVKQSEHSQGQIFK